MLLLAMHLVGAWLAGRSLARRNHPITTLAIGGAIWVALVLVIAVLFHLTGIPIRRPSLMIAFASTLAALTAANVWQQRHHSKAIVFADGDRIWLAGIVLYGLIIFPYTRFTGIDTYKWQDLATAVRMDECIPWLIHPVSLLGFTSRSYPSTLPVLQGCTQILGRLDVEQGFAVISLFVAIVGAACAYVLGDAVFKRSRIAAYFSLLYVFSPVFTRYTHWATGRGLLLAFAPLFVATLVRLPSARGWVSLLGCLILLPLCHKAGGIMLAIMLPVAFIGFLMPKYSHRWVIIAVTLPVTALALGVAPGPWTAFTRFAWMLPVAVILPMIRRDWLTSTHQRRLYPCLLAAIPLALEPYMYGALLALPFITLTATEGLLWFLGRWPRQTAVAMVLLAMATLTGALAVVVKRSSEATPEPVYEAAQFLEQHDPEGPFIVHAPGRARTQIQAYVSGCARIDVSSGASAVSLNIDIPGLHLGSPRETIGAWIAFFRGFLTVDGVETSWYGPDPTHYYVVIDGEGTCAQPHSMIYSNRHVVIYEAMEKHAPDPN